MQTSRKNRPTTAATESSRSGRVSGPGPADRILAVGNRVLALTDSRLSKHLLLVAQDALRCGDRRLAEHLVDVAYDTFTATAELARART